PDDTTPGMLDAVSEQISAAERRAMAAERETIDRLIAGYLADRVGATFSGRISGVTRSGLFVKLAETGADGFVPVSTIGHEYYRHDEALHALVGDRSGETYRLGDTVEVRLVEAAAVAGALRFEILSEGRSRSGAKGGGIKRSGSKASPGKAKLGKAKFGAKSPKGKPRPGKAAASESDTARRHRGSRR
ncbi:MAG: S1 RNA-binding domain-containing protein, partial [Methylobacteriaceae bacterium]